MSTFSISFVVRPSKQDKKGYAPIELSLSVNNERTYINTTRKCKTDDWNTAKQLVKRDKETNEFLNTLKSKLYECQTTLIKNNQEVTAKAVKELFQNNGKTKQVMLLQYYSDFMKIIETKLNNGQISTTIFNKHRITIKNLQSYIKEYYSVSDISLSEVDYNFIDNFFNHQRKTKSHNTALKDLERLKQVVLLSFNSGLIKANPFTLWKCSKEKKEVEFLTESEIKIIENKKIANDRLSKVRDVFIFCCYTALAYVDLSTLGKEHIKEDEQGNKWIMKSRCKTNVTAKIPLLPKAINILEKYDYQLPVLSNQKYNSYLDEIADVCNIRKNLHTHLARHSAATMFLNNGIPIEVVSKILGHTNIKQTQHYAKLLDKSIMDAVKGSRLFNV